MAERQRITVVFTYINDILATDGAIIADALRALTELKAERFPVMPITERRLGVC